MSVSEEIVRVPEWGGPNCRFEPLASHHIARLLPMEHEAYPDPWTQGMFRQEIMNACSHFFLAFEEKQMVGYGGFWLVLDEVHITKVTVAALHRRRGLGAVIVNYLLDEGRKAAALTARLEVRESNAVARRLYENLGFREVGVRKGYYRSTGENAIVMVKDLT